MCEVFDLFIMPSYVTDQVILVGRPVSLNIVMVELHVVILLYFIRITLPAVTVPFEGVGRYSKQ